MTIKQCILTGVDLTPDVDSKAHVIPSALGGTLKPLGILSQEANTILNDKVDFPLIKALTPIMGLIGGVPDRSEPQAVNMYTEDGKLMRVAFGKAIQLGAPEFKEEETEKGTVYQIAVRTMKEARTMLGRVKKKHPNFDIEAALAHAVMTESFVEGQLNIKLQFGPISVFPAIFAMAAVFATLHGVAPHPEFVSYINAFEPPDLGILAGAPIPHNSPLPPDTFYWMPSPSPMPPAPDDAVTHIVALVADPKRKRALVYAELFNLVCVGVSFPYDGDDLVTGKYGLNVLTGEVVDFTFDVDAVRALDWEATHTLGEPALFADTQARTSHLIGMAQTRSEMHEVLRIAQQVLGRPIESAPITPEEIGKIAQALAARKQAQVDAAKKKPI
jgi:hypothetical protein